MELFGFGSPEQIAITHFRIQTATVRIGRDLTFSFKLLNQGDTAAKVRSEYGLYYLKANEILSRKGFKISEREYSGKTSTIITRRQSFKIITTRKYHPGLHRLFIIINGTEYCQQDFILTL